MGCCTPLSNFEAGQNYRDVDDPAVWVTFPLVDEPDVKLVAWTTTPWTLPSNLALCLNPKSVYVKILGLVLLSFNNKLEENLSFACSRQDEKRNVDFNGKTSDRALQESGEFRDHRKVLFQ